MYPTTHTRYELPTIHPKSLKTADLLHHRYHVKEKIKRLAKLKRESRREAIIALKRRRKDGNQVVTGAEISIGISRAQNIYAINRSIANHWALLTQLEEQIKVRFRSHKVTSDSIFVDEEQAGQIRERSLPTRPVRQRRQHPRPCRHHTRPNHGTVNGDGVTDTQQCETEQPTFLQELRRSRLKRWEQRSNISKYRTAQDRVGGYVTSSSEVIDSDQT